MEKQKTENPFIYKEEWEFIRDIGLLMLLFLACLASFIAALVWILG